LWGKGLKAEGAILRENVEVVRRAFDILKQGVGRGDGGAAFDQSVAEGLIVSSLVWRGGWRAGSRLPRIGGFVGRNGYVEFTRTFAEAFDGYAIEVEQIIDAGNDRVVLIARHHATGNEGTAPVEIRTGAVFTLVGRHILQVDLFVEPDEALRAAGLQES
jgi:ketosteroid isomerase-like protein